MLSFSALLCFIGVAISVLATPSASEAGAPPAIPPAAVDLRPAMQKWGLETRPQGSRGTCSVFAITGALEYAVASKQKHGTLLSIEFLNWAGHKTANRTVDGGFFSELWNGFETYGVCPEKTLPYQTKFDSRFEPAEEVRNEAKKMQSLNLKVRWIKEWDVKTGMSDNQILEIKRVLARKSPVCGGLRWPKQEQWSEDGVLQMRSQEEVFDGHSVLLVGYRDDPKEEGGGVFFIRNSGGNSRDGSLPYAYIRAYMNDAVWIR